MEQNLSLEAIFEKKVRGHLSRQRQTSILSDAERVMIARDYTAAINATRVAAGIVHERLSTKATT